MIQRFGQLIRVRPECLEEYKRYHANIWPENVQMMQEANIRNYSIYHKDGFLFAYLEYHGDDFKADMAKNKDHPMAIEWQRIMTAMQIPLETRAPGEWWAAMEEVFHMD